MRKDEINLRFRDFYLVHIRYTLQWLLDIGVKFRQSHVFAGYPFLLANRYSDPADIETALFSGILVPPRGELKNNHFDFLQGVMGEHPSEWLESRMFVMLSTGDRLLRMIPEIDLSYWKIAQLYSLLWDYKHCVYQKRNGTEIVPKSLEDRFLTEMADKKKSASEVMQSWLAEYIGPKSGYKTDLLVWRLFLRDDIGLGLWGRGDEEMPWIWDRYTIGFLNDWVPGWRDVGTNIGIAKMFCDDCVSFYYLARGWYETRKRYKVESSRMLVHNKFGVNNRTYQMRRYWTPFFFDVDFS